MTMKSDRASEQSHRWFRMTVLKWYRSHGRTFPWRDSSISDYEKVLAEMLLQRTKAETVAQHYSSIVNRFPSWGALANANNADLIEALRPLGLWHQKASALKSLATELMRRRQTLPRERHDIEGLPGVGQYIANSIMLLCHNEPQPLLDGNMARVIERYFHPKKLKDIRYDPFLQCVSRRLINSKEAIAVNWAILDLAATVCVVRSPKCNVCPMARHCNYAREL